MFDLLALGAVLAVILCFFLPRSIEKKRDTVKSQTPTGSETELVAADTLEDNRHINDDLDGDLGSEKV